MTDQHYIAVVDDDESVRDAVTNLFRSMGLTARAFASAEEFLGSGTLEHASCLVLDVQMPGMGGLNLQTHLAGLGRFRLSLSPRTATKLFAAGHCSPAPSAS